MDAISARRKIPFLFLLLALVLLLGPGWPAVAGARPTASFQRGLTPGAARLLTRVQRLTEKEKYRQALAEIEKYRGGNPQKVPALVDFVAGNLNFQLDRYAAAAACYRRVVAAEPEFDEACENLGAALLMLKRYREAVRVLLEAAARRSEKAEKLRYQAALGALYGEDYKLARKLLAELVQKSPRPPADWLKALVQAELELKDKKAAARTAARLVDLYPRPAAHWRLYAQILLAAGQYGRALSALKVLEANDRLGPDGYRQLAGIYQQLELPAAAARAWEKGLAKKGEVKHAELETLVSLYRRAGDFDRALAVLGRIEKRFAADDRLRFLRGEILYQAGRWNEARRVFAGIKKMPGQRRDGRQFLLAGYCAWNENDFPAAAQAWERAATYPHLRRQAANLLKTLKPWLEEEKKEGKPEDKTG